MKRTFLITMGVAAVLALGVATANADMVLFLDDGLGNTKTVVDNDASDTNPTVGVISYSATLGPVWILNVETGQSDPFITPNKLRISSTNTSNAAGTLTIKLTRDGYTGATLGAGPWHLDSGFGGQAGSTIAANYFADHGNAHFATTFGPAAPEVGGPGAFGFNSEHGGFAVDPLFSMTLVALVTHTGAQESSYDHALQMIPEPGATLLGIIGLGALGMLRRRVLA